MLVYCFGFGLMFVYIVYLLVIFIFFDDKKKIFSFIDGLVGFEFWEVN